MRKIIKPFKAGIKIRCDICGNKYPALTLFQIKGKLMCAKCWKKKR